MNLELGDRVRCKSYLLRRKSRNWSSLTGRRGRHEWYVPTYARPFEGMVVGRRTYQNGTITGGVFVPDEWFPVVLVATHITMRPEAVRLQDVEVINEDQG